MNKLNPTGPWPDHIGPVHACWWKSKDEFVISAVDTTILFYSYANSCDTSKDNLANRFESKTEHEKNHKEEINSVCFSSCEDCGKIFGFRNDFLTPMVTLMAGQQDPPD